MAKKPNDDRSMLRFRLDEQEQRRIKSIAVERGITIQDLLVEALNNWLSRRGYGKVSGGSATADKAQPRSDK